MCQNRYYFYRHASDPVLTTLPERLRLLILESLRRMRRERMVRTHGRDYAAAVEDGLMDMREICAYLDTVKANMYHWVRSGKISSTLINGKLYFEPIQAKLEYDQIKTRKRR